MAQHTPGPWLSTRDQAGIHRVSSEAGRIGFTLELAAVNAPKDGRAISEEEAGANARLIAAAPDLLEALEPFRNYEDWPERAPDEMTSVRLSFGEWRKIIAAIVKAEGRADE